MSNDQEKNYQHMDSLSHFEALLHDALNRSIQNVQQEEDNNNDQASDVVVRGGRGDGRNRRRD